MTELLQSLSRGLGNGSAYALLAVSFVMIYKSTRVISFAQPAFMLAGAVAISYLVAIHIGFFPAVALAAAGIGLLALAVERTVIRPMVGKPIFAIVIITLGIDIFIRVPVNIMIGSNLRHVGDPWGIRTVVLAGVHIQQRHIAMLVTAAIVVSALFAFFKFSRIGLAMRASAFDQESALSQGVPVSMVFALSWALAGALAALAGAFVAGSSGIDQGTWVIALKALPAIVLGGLDSFEGAVIGGLAVGVVESFVGTYQGDLAPWLGANFAVVSPYVLMMLVLLVRPYGLFGTKEVTRV